MFSTHIPIRVCASWGAPQRRGEAPTKGIEANTREICVFVFQEKGMSLSVGYPAIEVIAPCI